MSRIVQVQGGATQVDINKQLYPANAKAVMTDYEFRNKVVAGAFTSILTDLGGGLLLSSAVTLSGVTEAGDTVATITPGFSGRLMHVFALVTTAVTTAGRSATFQTYVDQEAGTDEVQTLTITGTPTGGTFTLTYAGQLASGIVYNAAAAAVQTALEGLSNIAAGDVVCAGGPLPGTPVTITFTGSLAGQDVALIVANGAGLTGGTTPTATVATTTAGSPGTGAAPRPTTGGVIALTSANATPVGKIIWGTPVTFDAGITPSLFSSTGIISFRTNAAPTAFAEGVVFFGALFDPINQTGPLAN